MCFLDSSSWANACVGMSGQVRATTMWQVLKTVRQACDYWQVQSSQKLCRLWVGVLTVDEAHCNKKKSLKKILWAHFQFHSDLSHHDVLEEGCHLLYCSGEIGSSTCSPDSRCRRFLIETAALKSDRSFIGPCLPDLFKVRYHLSLVSSPFLWSKFTSMVFFCKFVHLFALLFCPSDCELWFTVNWISEKSIVNTCKMFTLRVDFLAAPLPRIPGYMVLFLFFGFAVSSTMAASFLYHVVRDKECIQS